MTEEAMHGVRRAVYDFVWQTAHLYKDAPGGKLACPQRPKLESYVESKMMLFDFMLERASEGAVLKDIVQDFMAGLESNFQAAVHGKEHLLSFYQKRKEECFQVLADPETSARQTDS
jgi:hypothetical protein